MYEVNKIYVWQNQVGQYAHLNGVECTVVAVHRGRTGTVWQTDTPTEYKGEPDVMMAEAGDLRLRNLPHGEKRIMDMF